MTKTTATPDNAVLLLGAAATLGLDKYVVQMKFGDLVAPDEVFTEAGFTIDEESGFAFLGEDTKQAEGKKVEPKQVDDPTEPKPAKVAAKKTAAKRAPAKKTAAKKTTAQAEKE